MPQQHYFSEQPSGESKLNDVSFELEGRIFNLKAASGTFSATKLDTGTRVLLKESKYFPSQGDVLDIGCGWGPISLAIAALRPETNVWGLDVNSRSLETASHNAHSLGIGNFRGVLKDEIPADLKFDAIWSNPPIRIGKSALHELMEQWLPRLKPGGSAMLVVQKQLGAESFQSWLSERFPDLTVSKHSIDKGYRVISVTSPTRSL